MTLIQADPHRDGVTIVMVISQQPPHEMVIALERLDC
jgi:hypothetical protein